MPKAIAALAVALLGAAAPAPSPEPPKPPPSDAECTALPAIKPPLAFTSGEVLEYDLDALGAQAGKLTLRVLPLQQGNLPIQAEARTNTFFNKIRRVSGGGTSYVNPRTLHPVRYVEDTQENEAHRYADVAFGAKDHGVSVNYKENDSPGHHEFKYAHDGLDVVGATYLMRQLPLQAGTSVCFDAYGVRRLWRVSGTVGPREHVSLPIGEFEAWHITGQAIRLDNHRMRREVHVWISADERRLPLVALGAIDLGAVRATLTAISRPGDKRKRAEGKENLKW